MTNEQKIKKLWHTQGYGFEGATNLELAVINLFMNASEEDRDFVIAALSIKENSNADNKDQSFLVDLMQFVTGEGV